MHVLNSLFIISMSKKYPASTVNIHPSNTIYFCAEQPPIGVADRRRRHQIRDLHTPRRRDRIYHCSATVLIGAPIIR